MLIHTQDTGNTIKAIAGDEYSKIVIGNDGKEQIRVCDLVGAFIEEGKKEANEKAIRKTIKRLRNIACSESFILESIMEDYELSEEEAREYLAESKSGSNLDLAIDELDKLSKDTRSLTNN